MNQRAVRTDFWNIASDGLGFANRADVTRCCDPCDSTTAFAQTDFVASPFGPAAATVAILAGGGCGCRRSGPLFAFRLAMSCFCWALFDNIVVRVGRAVRGAAIVEMLFSLGCCFCCEAAFTECGRGCNTSQELNDVADDVREFIICLGATATRISSCTLESTCWRRIIAGRFWPERTSSPICF